MATFIASYLLSALSMDSNKHLRCGLQSRSLSSFDLPVIKKKETTLQHFIVFRHGKCRKGEDKWLPKSWSLCTGTWSVMSSSSMRSSTVLGSVNTVIQLVISKLNADGNTQNTLSKSIYTNILCSKSWSCLPDTSHVAACVHF